jgi:hypothetical protein
MVCAAVAGCKRDVTNLLCIFQQVHDLEDTRNTHVACVNTFLVRAVNFCKFDTDQWRLRTRKQPAVIWCTNAAWQMIECLANRSAHEEGDRQHCSWLLGREHDIPYADLTLSDDLWYAKHWPAALCWVSTARGEHFSCCPISQDHQSQCCSERDACVCEHAHVCKLYISAASA